MKLLGNILWLIFGGLWWSICSFIMGCICCITIIGIPIGLQLFKISKFVLSPFGKEVVFRKNTGFKTFLNVLWAIFFGWEYFLCYSIWGCICCVTIIGIPFGKQYFKLASFMFLPLGRDFKNIKSKNK